MENTNPIVISGKSKTLRKELFSLCLEELKKFVDAYGIIRNDGKERVLHAEDYEVELTRPDEVYGEEEVLGIVLDTETRELTFDTDCSFGCRFRDDIDGIAFLCKIVEHLGDCEKIDQIDRELLDVDIYYVEEENGSKIVNLQRYYYQSEGYYITCTEFTGVRLTELPITRDGAVEAEDSCQQYTSYVTIDEFNEDIKGCKRLPITEVNQNTECGKYIDVHQD